MINKKPIIITFLFLLISLHSGFSQCKVTNNAFQSGEKLSYDLYFKYGLINARAGSGTLTTTSANLDGKDALKTTLLVNTTGVAESMYSVHDTLTGYVDSNIVPMLFTKEAHESGDYSRERQSYSYKNGKTNIRVIRHWNGKLAFDETVSTENCVYDYISVLNYVRNIDYSSMKAGDNIPIRFISGRKIVNMYIRFLGNERIKVNNGKTYNSIKLSLMVLDDSFADQQEAMRVSLTDDLNRMPLSIEIGLKIGSIRVILKKHSELRHPVI